MTNFICGLVGVVLFAAFLGFYAVRLNSVALWAIVISVLLMVAFDFIQSVRDKNHKSPADD